MRIKSVALENIRSHVKSIVEFTDGFNCLVGGLGRGKSSILLAIDFALFGTPLGRSYEYLIREGADIGKVALKFLKDGREYTILRALRRRDGHIAQDMEQLKLFEGDKMIAEMKSEAVAEQLRSITGIDRDLFREVIWMRQERLKDLLDMSPGERQRRLDQLFGLSDYEVAWNGLRPILRWYEGERNSLRRDPDIGRIGELQTQYDEAVREFSLKEMELADFKRRLSEAEARLKEASAEVDKLEDLRRRNEELRREEAKLQERVIAVEDASARLMDEIASRESRIKSLEDRLGSFKSQEDTYRRMLEEIGLPSDQTVMQLREYSEVLISQMTSIHGEREMVEKQIEEATQRMENLMKENRCPLCLQNLTPDYKRNLFERLQRETGERKERLNELQRNAKELERIRTVVSSVSSNLQLTLARMEEAKKQLEEDRRLLQEASIEFEQMQREEREVRQRLGALRKEIGEFDISELEKSQRLRDLAFEEYSKIKYALQTAESEKKEISLRMETLKERLEIAEQKVNRILKVETILELAKEIRVAYRSIQPKLRSEFITYLERIVQQELDELMGFENASLNIRVDEKYTPFVESPGGHQREVSNLSGGERTFLAFAYRLGIGQLIMQSRLGHGLSMLLLDEPTESLGREDGSIERLAEAISRLKTIEQVIAVTHSEAFAERADHVIRLEKEDNISRVFGER
ncbi:MAG: AAA family ATPase [Candidatus Bathyarchaeia archaeon]